MHKNPVLKPNFNDPTSCWKALVSRDPAATNAFIYGVKTTHIYCRPTCPARLARRANVCFFDGSARARELGFRACKRCKPDLPAYDPQGELVEKACRNIEASSETLQLGELAIIAGKTKSHFHRVFRKVTGVTPKTYGEIAKFTRLNSTKVPETVPYPWDEFVDYTNVE
jgi:prepilin-type processing-associated H-X9-DG protein